MLLALPAQAVEVDGSLRAWAGVGLDTNPHRDFKVPDLPCTATNRSGCTEVDAFFQGLLQLDGALRFERAAFGAGYDLGGRKFVLTKDPEEDTLVQTGQLHGELFLSKYVGLGAEGSIRDRRGAGRNYTSLSGEGYLRFLAAGRLDSRVRVGAQRFLYWTLLENRSEPYRGDCCFYGATVGLNARFKLTPRHSIGLSIDFEPRAFDVEPFANPDLDPPPTLPAQRADNVLVATVGYRYRGRWAFDGSFSFLESASNSYARSLRRFSFSASAGVQLFWRLSLMGNAVLQFVQYPDGLYLPPDGTSSQEGILTYDADETGPHVSLRLVRPLGDFFEVDLKYQVFFAWLELGKRNETDPGGLTYQRHTVTLGFSFRLDSY